RHGGCRGGTLTSGDQSEAESDRTLTQKIRQAVMADKSLSMTAHNVKIITVAGRVTLRGAVKSEDERKNVAAKAEQIAGADKVQNHLEVAKKPHYPMKETTMAGNAVPSI